LAKVQKEVLPLKERRDQKELLDCSGKGKKIEGGQTSHGKKGEKKKKGEGSRPKKKKEQRKGVDTRGEKKG